MGPGTYREEDALVQRLRPDRMVLPWHPRREGVAEHLVGLHKAGEVVVPQTEKYSVIRLHKKYRGVTDLNGKP